MRKFLSRFIPVNFHSVYVSGGSLISHSWVQRGDTIRSQKIDRVSLGGCRG